MTISVWRYSHLALAISSAIFIALASLTGLVLAFEPVSNRMQPYAIANLDQITLAQTVASAQKNYAGIIEIKIEKNKFVQADVITKDGQSAQIYLNPKTGKSLGKVEPENELFQFVTTLHRSLFLHGLGRFFMGLSAFLLLLIAVTGSILVVRRQRKISRFFSKVVRENFFQFYHVVLGRLWLGPIIIIAATGTLLALNEFEVFDKSKPQEEVDSDTIKAEPKRTAAQFPSFQKTKLCDVISVEFPFSSEPEDAFLVKLQDREWTVSQFTGEILDQKLEPSVKNWINLSLDLHTGRASIFWALVLAIACLNILFFIYSGFSMTFRRRSGKVRNPFKKHQAEFIVLAGSENGSTMRFAQAVHEAILKTGKKSYFAELNQYETFKSVKYIVAITATYGLGEPPTNAGKALRLIQQFPQNNTVHFSVVGFGSHAYPDFCRFAYDLHNAMAKKSMLPLLEIETINDKSTADFVRWAALFAQKAQIGLAVNAQSLAAKPAKKQSFIVTSKTVSGHDNHTFLIRMKPVRKIKFTSGDLLSIYPANDLKERQYSIGKIGGEIQLSVKLHPNGLGSNYLHDLQVGTSIRASVVRNPNFHFPKKATTAILISNGTGIAPFLGMIEHNQQTECHLYCGFRNADSFAPYQPMIDAQLSSGKLGKLNLAYSRQGEKQYVRDVLSKDAQWIASVLNENGTIMICGSLAMQSEVLELLDAICQMLGRPPGHFRSNGQIKTDCY
jgi:sulfite reductase (NADPH) flavoprotein alpha-component